MVFLRLTVKIFPREQQPSSSSFSLRSILGDRSSDREDATRTTNTTSTGKPASFLLVLTEPQDVTLGGLAGMIRDKWVKLRPNAEPLHIKKLLDDDHEADDLDADMTVADVFVDNGLSHVDGRDQRRTVRVIQKPAPYAPTRFPSVSLDWDAAAEDFQRQQAQKKDAVHKFPAIPEEGSVSHEDRRDGQDTPMKSVEDDEEIPGSPQPDPDPGQQGQPQVHEPDSQGNGDQAVEATPQHAPGHGPSRGESQELGSPTPTVRTRRRSTSARGRPAQRTISRMADMRTAEPVESDEEESTSGRRLTRSKVQRQKSDQDNEEEEEEEEEEEKDQDGDIGMDGHEKTTRGKRKNSQEDLRPSKEPRLDSQEPDRSVSPSASRKPSFSRTGRRTSFTEQHSPPKSGLGLGITQSPSRKRPAVEPPSNAASVPAAAVLSSSGGKPTAPEKDTTPSSTKLLTPFTEKEPSKPLHSALRKPSPVDKPSEPRSVSFSGKKDIIPARPAQEPKSTPTSASTPTPSTDQWLDKMHFPPTISSEHAKKLVQEEKEKIERENQMMREDEEKLTRAKEDSADPEFIRLLEELCRTRAWIADTKASGGSKTEKKIQQAEQQVANLGRKLARVEAKSKTEKTERGGRKTGNKLEKAGGKTGNRTEKAEKDEKAKGKGEKKAEKTKREKTKPEKTDPTSEAPNGLEKGNDKKGKQKGRSEPESAGSAKNAEHAKSTAPTGPAEPEPAGSAKNTEHAKSAEPTEPAEPEPAGSKNAEHAKSTAPTGPAEPAADAKPAEQSKLQNELTNGDIPTAEPDRGNQDDAQEPRPESQTEVQGGLQPEKSQDDTPEEQQPEVQQNQTPDEQSDDLKLPAMPNVRSVEQSKRSPGSAPVPASQPASRSASAAESKSAPASESKPASTPAAPSTLKQTSPKQADESSSSSSSSSDASSSSDEETNPSGISQSQPHPPTSRFSSPWARAQSQSHTQPFQAINRTARTSLSSLKNIMDQQKSEHDARVQQTRQASHQPRKDIFDPSSDSDDSDSDSDSDSDEESHSSSADEGDIQSSGTVGKLRKAISWRKHS